MFASFPELIAGYNVLHRLLMPRHPPCTLSSLTTFIDHRHGVCDMRLQTRQEELTPPDQQPPLSDPPAGELVRYKRLITGHNRQKGARRLLPDRKTKMGRESQRFHASSVNDALTFEPRHSLVKEHPALMGSSRLRPLRLRRSSATRLSRRTRVSQQSNTLRTDSGSADVKAQTDVAVRFAASPLSSVTSIVEGLLSER